MTIPVDLHQLETQTHELTTIYNEGKAHGHGLITQLQATSHRTLTRAGDTQKVRTSKTGSKPPSSGSNQALDLLALIETAVWNHDADLRDHLNDHLNYTRPWTTALQQLPLLARRTGDTHTLTHKLAKETRTWHHRSRLTLGYIKPLARLQAPCPYCQQTSLRVQSDATSDVTCTTPGCQDERGETPRWDRTNWILLLTGNTA